MYQQKVQKEENSSSSKQKKKISEWWNNRKQRIHRQIEYARLKRIRKNTVPHTLIARTVEPDLKECTAINADNML